tara:strand:+ start:1116 stop:1217 length:102 start_codon:yes stop_codon:yes gene_type:complete
MMYEDPQAVLFGFIFIGLLFLLAWGVVEFITKE